MPFTLLGSRFSVRVSAVAKASADPPKRFARRRAVAALLVIALAPLLVYAQGRRSAAVKQVAEYTGNLTFTRIAFGSGGLAGFGFGGAAWSHDYPAADRNVGAIIDYITNARVHLEETNILTLDDPEIFQNPVLYIWEPGYWTIQPSEAENLRKYLKKGGFVIFDDFEGPDHWENMAAQMRRALPDHVWVQIDERHPIFQSFYNITKIDVPHPSVNVTPAYFAMYENNDPTRRMIALANHNNDIAEYWEWSAEGLYNPDPTSNAYRLGVNYFIYALTH
jgi:hypothetical protein